MELGLRLAQKQTLKLVMTPRLQQALKLLQMPSLELSQHIEQELLTNPLLEVEEDDPQAPNQETEERPDSDEKPEPTSDSEGDAPEDSGPEPEAGSKDTDADGSSDETPETPEETPDSKEDDFDWSDFIDEGFEYGEGVRNEREETEFFERTPVVQATLADSLTGQLHLLELDDETARIAEYLLGCLDDHGFLVVPLEEVADQLGVTVEAAEAALRRIQELEPSEIGARNLPESLVIQLRQLGREDSLAARIVGEHFEAFKQKQYQEIARALKVTPADIQEAGREISHLNPRPGAQLALEDSPYVVPDLVVEKVDGQYVVALSEGSVPRLRVSRQYRQILERGPAPAAAPASGEETPGNAQSEPSTNGSAAPSSGDRAREKRNEEVRFVQDKLKSANWLIQTIEQRRRTMIKVMEAIVEAQSDFFEQGPEALKPLTLQDVAEKIGMHESTVSRVTTNKYVQTPRGVLPLKYFFSSGLDTESGGEVSSKMAMERIRLLIEKENRKKPLSDQKIAELLRKEGLIVARRTVAKYREKLGILSARYRKEF
ncbi:MAG TPA: RNA polymerase sigma-54 factor [bacterium]|nr:RNA polymerase sigma-54 factor [bacterium]